MIFFLLFQVTLTRILKFNENNKFKVLQITDIHYGEEFPQQDPNTTELMKKLIKIEKPDLVVITGDGVSGYSWDQSDGWYQKQWTKITEAFNELQQPYMYVLGNHDAQADLNGRQISELDQTNPNSWTLLGQIGISGNNYYQKIYDQRGQKVEFYLWAFDSGIDSCLGVNGWGCIGLDAIQWYKDETQKMIQNNEFKQGHAFMHIPLQEYLYLATSSNQVGTYGSMLDGVSCSVVNTGLFAQFLYHKNVNAVFCGHDHNNDFYGNYLGINLYFGRKTGYGGYGPAKGLQRGARVIEYTLNETVTYESWIRQEDMTRIDKLAFNKLKDTQCGMPNQSLEQF